ncbi:MAG TPA: hypothetical protein VIK75_10520 [Calditerricola sp.]
MFDGDLHVLLAHAVHLAPEDDPTAVVNGKVLMRNRRLLTIDEAELFRQVEKRAARIVEGIEKQSPAGKATFALPMRGFYPPWTNR